MTPKERAAMQQALEALESCTPEDTTTSYYVGKDYDESAVYEAITALREALAEPELNLNCKSVQKRLATVWGYVKAEQAEQEPVAEVVVRPLRGDQSQPTTDIKWLQRPTTGKLYTAPVRTKDLTDDELRQVLDRNCGDGLMAIARAVIAADREKNK